MNDIRYTPNGEDDQDVEEVEVSQIENLRMAIAHDEEQARLAEENADTLRLLQKKETSLKGKLAKVQEDIVGCINKTFDTSDPVTLQSARETLKILEARSTKDNEKSL